MSFRRAIFDELGGFDDRLTRGGPLSRVPPGGRFRLTANSDSRKSVQYGCQGNWTWDDAGGRSAQFTPFLHLHPDRLTAHKESGPGIELLGRDPGALWWKDNQRGRKDSRRTVETRTRPAVKRFHPTTRRNSRISAVVSDGRSTGGRCPAPGITTRRAPLASTSER